MSILQTQLPDAYVTKDSLTEMGDEMGDPHQTYMYSCDQSHTSIPAYPGATHQAGAQFIHFEIVFYFAFHHDESSINFEIFLAATPSQC